jgi:hypothetical protein
MEGSCGKTADCILPVIAYKRELYRIGMFDTGYAAPLREAQKFAGRTDMTILTGSAV